VVAGGGLFTLSKSRILSATLLLGTGLTESLDFRFKIETSSFEEEKSLLPNLRPREMCVDAGSAAMVYILIYQRFRIHGLKLGIQLITILLSKDLLCIFFKRVLICGWIERVFSLTQTRWNQETYRLESVPSRSKYSIHEH
jgi:hypothetical protein